MTLNGAIMQLVEMRENSMMPEVFKPYLDKVIETVSECEEPSVQPEPSQVARDIATILENEQDMRVILKNAQPEIIRCKECRHWREHKYAKETKRYIPFCGFNAIYTKADDFCSKGERRTDEQT